MLKLTTTVVNFDYDDTDFPLCGKNEILEIQGLKTEKIFWHPTKEEEEIVNLAVISGGPPLNGASIWPRSLYLKVDDNKMMKINVMG